MHIPPPSRRPWDLNREEIDLVKNQICKGATDAELQLCLTQARRFRLDPLRGQIWFVPYGRGDERKWQAIVGINGLLHIAARDHKDFGSIDEPEYGPMVSVKWVRYERGGHTTTGTLQAPEWAKVSATKKGMTLPTVAKVWFTEIYSEAAIGYSDKVRSMPRHMIGKVATAHAVRKAWPATDGLYIAEEFQNPAEFTDGGRRIVKPEPDAITVPALDENAAHGHQPGSQGAQNAEAALKRVEEADAALKRHQKPIDVDKEEREAIEAESASNASPVVPVSQDAVSSAWPKTQKASSSVQGGAQEGATTPPLGSGSTSKDVAGTASGPIIAKGVIEQFTEKMTKGRRENPDKGIKARASKPYLSILIKTEKGSQWVSLFDKELFVFIEKGKIKKQGEFMVSKSGEFWNLVGFRTLEHLVFEPDGKTTCLQKDREPGSPRLF